MPSFIFLLIVFLFNSTNAYAYIDPGAGAFILQSIIAFLGIVAFYLGYPIRIIKSFFKKKDKNSLNKEHSKDKKSQ